MAIEITSTPEKEVAGTGGYKSNYYAGFNPIVYKLQASDYLTNPNYYIECELKIIKVIADVPTVVKTLNPVFQPNTSGVVKIDLSSRLRSFFKFGNTSDYSDIFTRNEDFEVQYEIGFRERWDDHTEEYSLVKSGYAINAAKQIQHINNGNMLEHLLYTDTPLATDKAKFMTPFQVPKYFPGYPFDLSILSTGFVNDENPAVEPFSDSDWSSSSAEWIYAGDIAKLSVQESDEGSSFDLSSDASISLEVGRKYVLQVNRVHVDHSTLIIKIGTVTIYTHASTVSESGIIDVPFTYTGAGGSVIHFSVTVGTPPFSVLGPPYEIVKLQEPLIFIVDDVLVRQQNNLDVNQSSLAIIDEECPSNIFRTIRIQPSVPLDAGVSFFKIKMKLLGESTGTETISEEKLIEVHKAEMCNPVYLAWVGTDGGWNYWLFTHFQENGLVVGEQQTFEPYFEDIISQDAKDEVVSKSAKNTMKLGADNLSIDQYSGIKTLLYSPKVQMLISSSPLIWQTVIVNTGTFTIDTSQLRPKISFTINLPELNIQSQ